jgi:hypothetical protein
VAVGESLLLDATGGARLTVEAELLLVGRNDV